MSANPLPAHQLLPRPAILSPPLPPPRLLPGIVICILEEGCRAATAEDPSEDPSSYNAISLRYFLLCSAALVCRTWKDVAVPMLHREIVLENERRANLLVGRGVFGSHQTRRLAIGGPTYQVDGVPAKVAGEVLTLVKGVRKLQLWGFGAMDSQELDFSWLYSPNFSDLTALDLDVNDFRVPIHPLQSPFTLRFSHISDCSRVSTSAYLYTSLASTFPTFLHLGNVYEDSGKDIKSGVEAFLVSVGEGVEGLSVTEPTKLLLLDRLPSILNRFNKLQHLELRCSGQQLITILRALPYFLTSLNLAFSNANQLLSIISILNLALSFTCFHHLRCLEINFRDGEEFESAEGGLELMKAMKERGVRVEFIRSWKT